MAMCMARAVIITRLGPGFDEASHGCMGLFEQLGAWPSLDKRNSAPNLKAVEEDLPRATTITHDAYPPHPPDVGIMGFPPLCSARSGAAFPASPHADTPMEIRVEGWPDGQHDRKHSSG